MLHHISFGVADLQRAAAFYEAVLAPLGYARVWEDATGVGFGRAGADDNLALKLRPHVRPPGPGFHLAFSAPSQEAVAAFHAAALRKGGKDNGSPGLRPHYGPTYYAAFVIDPDDHPIEAVFTS